MPLARTQYKVVLQLWYNYSVVKKSPDFYINYNTNLKNNFGHTREIENIGDMCINYPSCERG
jgi:hypothetical protein